MGRPVGAENKDKPFKAALRRLLGSAGSNPDKLDEIALTAAKEAARGNIAAMQLIRDSLDGRPAQAIVGDDTEDAITVRQIITGVPRKEDE